MDLLRKVTQTIHRPLTGADAGYAGGGGGGSPSRAPAGPPSMGSIT
jgi:hypothetical protein